MKEAKQNMYAWQEISSMIKQSDNGNDFQEMEEKKKIANLCIN